jgi:cell division protein FtsL
MAKKVGRKAGGRGGTTGRTGKIFLVLVGFVVRTMGVILRRVQGLQQARQIREMQQKSEALRSEESKLQEAIRLASDRKHIIDIAQSRLGMKMPELNQVIDLPRRPPVARRDTSR